MSEFSLREIVSLIKACRASGVQEIALKDIRIVMSVAGTLPVTPNLVPKGAEEKVEAIRKESNMAENLSFAEDNLATALLEDPLEFERQITSGELVEGEEAQDIRTQ
jgi:hypothetical protein